jgi:hypothetical protein
MKDVGFVLFDGRFLDSVPVLASARTGTALEMTNKCGLRCVVNTNNRINAPPIRQEQILVFRGVSVDEILCNYGVKGGGSRCVLSL